MCAPPLSAAKAARSIPNSAVCQPPEFASTYWNIRPAASTTGETLAGSSRAEFLFLMRVRNKTNTAFRRFWWWEFEVVNLFGQEIDD
jgi:hypothetical protein